MATPGTLVEYFNNKKLLCALSLSVDRKDQVHVRTEEGREDRVAKAKLIFSGSGSDSLGLDSSPERITEWLKAASARRDACARGVALEELWELVAEEGGVFSLKDLAELQFSSPAADQMSGLYRALEGDRVWFFRKGQDYAPRTRDQVQETRNRLLAEEEKAREREVAMRWLRDLWRGDFEFSSGSELDKTQARYLNWIREVALLGNEAPRFKDIQALFKELDIGGKDAAFRLLVKAGVWGPDEFLTLHRLHPPMEFEPELLAAADRCRDLLQAGLTDPERLDLTHLPALTIDDQWTSEVDDGLTLERTAQGFRLGIHIADASHFVQPGTALDDEGLDRGTTIYLPERKIRMLPDVLGDELCSLSVGAPRLAFSFLVDTDADFQPTASQFALTRIQVARRLTYEEADALIAAGDDPVLADLHRAALALRAARQAKGAVTLPFPRANLRVEIDEAGEPQISITRDASEVPAQTVVSEMMILANKLSGECFAEHSIPALFRSQPEPEKPIPADVDPAPESLYKLRRLMKKGEVGLVPARHAGLGLDAYSQATSPIRRYVDLLAQRQLKAHLKGEPLPYSAEQVAALAPRLERTTQQAEQLERERKQYWTLRFLEQKRWAELDAVVLQNLPDKHWVQLTSVLYELECPLVPRHPLPPGSRLKVRIELVWPREGTVRVTPVLEDDENI